ncbi:MAG TPA: hypothetical protein VFH95_09960 [Candidatus Kapabacteria bacterium]|nr:hypothetical protein [Candidatus Kapabacteria bacterium]
MKIFQEVRRDLTLELAFCKSPRDVAKPLGVAETSLKQSTVTLGQKQLMWEEIKRLLDSLLKDREWVVEARTIIDDILKRNK